jgi:hypothetical protein
MYASRMIYSIYIYVIKFGFLSHYLSFGRVSSARMKLLLWLTVAFNAVAGTASISSTALFCIPIHRAWRVLISSRLFGPISDSNAGGLERARHATHS